MISRIRGSLLARELNRAEVMTPGGVAYEIEIPTSVYERLPRPGEEVELLTLQVVREDAWLLFGFLEENERRLFSRLIAASGVGPRLALALLSALPAPALVRAIRERNLAVLTGVSGVGKKTAERISVELAGKLDDLAFASSGIGGQAPGTEEALRALVVLGLSALEAENAVRAVVQEQGPLPAQELIRAALARPR
ncbi:MAG TPA: Holliday junction branch migration protein RuvA [Longimicrobiaceae bacterium]|nr:Holliday junction branch migration protein RuvA [Longimicrobiaceae bacterium]